MFCCGNYSLVNLISCWLQQHCGFWQSSMLLVCFICLFDHCFEILIIAWLINLFPCLTVMYFDYLPHYCITEVEIWLVITEIQLLLLAMFKKQMVSYSFNYLYEMNASHIWLVDMRVLAYRKVEFEVTINHSSA